MALVIAVIAQAGDIGNRKVDRVLELHREMTSGQTGDARTRLGWFYRHSRSNGTLPRLTRAQLKSETYKESDMDCAAPTPRLDSDRLLRFFERVNAARDQGSLDDYSAALLLGRQATWWDRAIRRDDDDPTRRPLAVFADWSSDFVRGKANDPRFAGWATRTELDFPQSEG